MRFKSLAFPTGVVIGEKHINVTVFGKMMCIQDKQYLGAMQLHFAEELVTLDGISWSASRSCGSKTRPQKWTVS